MQFFINLIQTTSGGSLKSVWMLKLDFKLSLTMQQSRTSNQSGWAESMLLLAERYRGERTVHVHRPTLNSVTWQRNCLEGAMMDFHFSSYWSDHTVCLKHMIKKTKTNLICKRSEQSISFPHVIYKFRFFSILFQAAFCFHTCPFTATIR